MRMTPQFDDPDDEAAMEANTAAGITLDPWYLPYSVASAVAGAWRDIGLADRQRAMFVMSAPATRRRGRSVPQQCKERELETRPFARVWTDVKGKVMPHQRGDRTLARKIRGPLSTAPVFALRAAWVSRRSREQLDRSRWNM